LYDRFGDDFDDGTSSIPVALSRRELAELVATSFETAIRVMTRWERAGVLDTTPTGFTVRKLDVLKVCAGSDGERAAE
jgi:CRP-like cAMP-binding protein